MFDFNQFKKSVKVWIKDHPSGTVTELRDYCEEQIPVSQFAANEWLVDQTLSWYRHILNQREIEAEDPSSYVD
ncbi:MAG: hypothetical protein CMP10_08260 [Zetaproteobacteria bacterium]|nr:hypothetical protein [Pseudobdellovibrionaceae bacterium]|tara:strand:+ start:1248 stop:1466 length:219 start_codon:yes stop_codon:yes gene_type:complete